ncbi:MAG: S-ribosylhomocysteine lyase [Clostridia bacterium]
MRSSGKETNAEDYMSHLELHTIENLFATFIRNSEIGGNILYFVPMGCHMAFYLHTRGSNSKSYSKR